MSLAQPVPANCTWKMRLKLAFMQEGVHSIPTGNISESVIPSEGVGRNPNQCLIYHLHPIIISTRISVCGELQQARLTMARGMHVSLQGDFKARNFVSQFPWVVYSAWKRSSILLNSEKKKWTDQSSTVWIQWKNLGSIWR